MIDRISAKNGERLVLELNLAERCDMPLCDELELWLDQHYGIKVVRGDPFTMVSFRQARAWSTPVEARDLYHKVSLAKKSGARPARRASKR